MDIQPIFGMTKISRPITACGETGSESGEPLASPFVMKNMFEAFPVIAITRCTILMFLLHCGIPSNFPNF